MRYFHYLTILTISYVKLFNLFNYNLTNKYNISLSIPDNNLSRKSIPYYFTYPIYEQI